MKKKKLLLKLVGVFGVLALLATTTSTFWLYSELKAVKSQSESAPVVTAQPEGPKEKKAEATESEKKEASAKVDAAAQLAEPETREMKIKEFIYNGQDTMFLVLSGEPDMSVIQHYVTVEPLTKGKPSINFINWWNWETRKSENRLRISGDFAHRTNLTLRVRKGLPFASATMSTNHVYKALAEDFERVVQRKDKPPQLDFVHEGRYLPPVGRRALALKSINMNEIRAQIRAVPSANIVSMLALETYAYKYIERGYWGDDSRYVVDLSGEPLECRITPAVQPNEEVRSELIVTPPTGVASNGVFFVTLSDAALEENTWEWRNRAQHRVVCLTDFGISARRTKSGVSVWVTSLTTGTPIEGAVVEVYSTANILVAKGVTSAQGWCAAETVAPGEPFAVVVSAPDGSDRSFIALRRGMAVDENEEARNRADYLAPDDCTAFVWTERGIYRHDEPIFFHALLRNGRGAAPKPFPLTLELRSPREQVLASRTVLADAEGSITDESFVVDADRPSGTWTFVLKTPGEKGKILGTRHIKIEEFVPPQIRVKVEPARDTKPQDFNFTVSAEHLYGGPAKALRCTGAVVFEDANFAPAAWKGWMFGNEDLGLKPNFRELQLKRLDQEGRCRLDASLVDYAGKPKTAVRAIAQGTVFEDGGRAATVRGEAILHYYPFYIGTTLKEWVRKPSVGRPSVSVVCVGPDGVRLPEVKQLKAKLERVESIYSYKRNDEGWSTWTCEHVSVTVAEDIAVETSATDEPAVLEIPADSSGDYRLTITDPASDVSFARAFYLSDWGDETVRAPLANPTAVSITTDKAFYRPGETPRLVVKSPFAGTALLNVLRDDLVYSEVLTLTNATSEVLLKPCEAEWAPNVNVRLSVVQGVTGSAKGLAARAHGGATVVVRRPENEIPVKVTAVPHVGPGGSETGSALTATVLASGATHAVVTLVDEGINLLTGEPTPDPIGFFAVPRLDQQKTSGFYDLYRRLLPVLGDDALKANGVKTGGGYDAEMLGRVSPLPTRRFKPLALWRKEVPVVDGKAEVSFTLPEFVGEVRVTALAYSDTATGAASVRQKVCPNLVMEADAPRFVAPGDRFRITLPLANRAPDAVVASVGNEIAYSVTTGTGAVIAQGTLTLATGDSTVLRFETTAPQTPGQLVLHYEAKGLGERHEKTIELPVRPAVAWQEVSGVVRLEPGEAFAKGLAEQANGIPAKFSYKVSGSQMGELSRALEWLADYPHGCLEQTSSRIFPLIAADGVLNAVGSVAASNRADYVKAGVSRVESMIREHHFVMWPDCNYAPWDDEVSLYAAHFLVEASRAGVRLEAESIRRVKSFLDRWSLPLDNSVSAYACHTLALEGHPNKDRMLSLYDDRDKLDLLSRARLARAFVAIADRTRAEKLLANADAPSSVREAAFLLLAILEIDADDARLPALVTYLTDKREPARYSWGTTSENAHALLALAAYYKAHPAPEGKPEVRDDGDRLVNTGTVPAFVSWRRLTLPAPEAVPEETSSLHITRDYLTADGKPYDLEKAACGDLVIVRLTLTSDVARDYSDLVIEDLLPGAFEPVRSSLRSSAYPWFIESDHDWVMRSDARDDRMLVFSENFQLRKDESARFHYPLRVVSTGDYALPGVAVEAMYQPSLRARTRASRLIVRE